MKTLSTNFEKKTTFNSFETLSDKEMLKVRGGGDLKPKTRDKDIYDVEEL